MPTRPRVASRDRDLPGSFDPQVVAAIDARLVGVAREHGVHVPWAVESGSRAWGFPSPDSDYDCRFVYVRPVADYLDPWPPRDVVETPLDAVLDVNGWDLLKVVRLAVGGNATPGEWLRSPLVYAGEPQFRDELLDLVDAAADRQAVRRHYLHVGRDQWQRSGAAHGAQVALKRVFYGLRPAAALHWLTLHDGTTPPMNLTQLLDEAPPPADVRDDVEALVAAKAVTRELGTGTVPPALRAWVDAQLSDAADADVSPDGTAVAQRRAEAAARFRGLVARWAPEA
ncbi:nucleotidyltransferase domain-containing protein [Cellulomonas xiejunii]|uniref:Nucleotidyltransferase domain-containing protein n=1 Tax=Cellulomonas xiejunii TaxID=2968083 RepID=A0ABY5KIP7_9CELL|nr:nucleotidyltransferase domain-containing protein [Cellulomonas xiejunii]MCC2320038.1 nucleotidyltransferase domain-containing protein [Cellulomonas xiejunii]UUI70352.1 nucleotidyltransferase domain-containing protein [Cellulomonas xiejunii]